MNASQDNLPRPHSRRLGQVVVGLGEKPFRARQAIQVALQTVRKRLDKNDGSCQELFDRSSTRSEVRTPLIQAQPSFGDGTRKWLLALEGSSAASATGEFDVKQCIERFISRNRDAVRCVSRRKSAARWTALFCSTAQQGSIAI